MALSAGTRIGPYQVVSALGAGGMGEVYRALDTVLKREVAIKVLLPEVADNPDRLARFSREAQLLASLNHPNIAHVHGIEQFDGWPALVMELVEGPTLADRIEAGALALDDVVAIARQIVDALAAAHDSGVIHRDLKPSNIKLRPDGTVKVLDFGLAKAFEPTTSPGFDAVTSPTLTMRATREGIILGTAAYMSPEQARGRPVDKRTDIWAFGVVLYEMLTGQGAFRGDDVSATLAVVITQEPNWERLPSSTPASMRRLLRRCLEKDVKRRLPDIAVARLELDEAIASPPGELSATVPTAMRRSRAQRAWPFAAVAAIAAIVGGLIAWVARPTPRSTLPVTRFSVMLPTSQELTTSINDRDLALSPAATHLAYTAGPQSQLIVQAFDQLEARPVAGIANARAPFFSSDGRWIGFFNQLDEGLTTGSLRDGELKKVSLSGGPPITLCQLVGGSRGASWADDNTIVFATNDTATGLLRVSAAGGQPTVLTFPDPAKGEQDHQFPSMLPGGRGVLFTIVAPTRKPSQVAVLDVKTGDYKTLIRDGSQAQYVDTGHLIYVVAGTLWTVRFSLSTLEVSGDPVPVGDQVTFSNAANFSVSPGGALAYVPRDARSGRDRSLVWVGRDGSHTAIAAPPRPYDYPRLSPDDTRVAVRITEQAHSLWAWEFGRNAFTRLTPDGRYSAVVWSADGTTILYTSVADETSIMRRRSDGTGGDERLTSAPFFVMPLAISPDGTRVVFQQQRDVTDYDVMLLSLDGTARISPLLQTPTDDRSAELSPDGRWLAYESNESRRFEIYVRPFPNVTDAQYQISTEGGRTPVWSSDGRELFFANSASLMAASIEATPQFRAGTPVRLFEDRSLLLDARSFSTGAHRTFDVSRDGRRFLIMKFTASPDPTNAARIVVVQNWAEELKRVASTQ